MKHRIIELIREGIEFRVNINRLKRINRAADKYNKLTHKVRVQANVVHKLVERYNELYPNNRIEVKHSNETNTI